MEQIIGEYSNLNIMSDWELIEILGGESSGDVQKKAKTILETRQISKDRMQREKLVQETFSRLDRFLGLFEKLVEKPKTAAFFAGLFAVIVTVSINIITEYLLQLLKLK